MTQQHYEQRLQADRDAIRQQLQDVSTLIDTGLQHALQALLRQDSRLANDTILKDNPINRAIRTIDRKCYHFVARHLPTAGHLRFISSVLRLNIGLERIGDYAVTICRETIALSAPLGDTLRREIERMAEDSLQMYRQAMTAFLEGNAELARGTKAFSDHVDRTFASAFEYLIKAGQDGKYSIHDLFATLSILNVLERVSDQAKNICEVTIFAVTGQQKKTKAFNILFVDETGDGRAVLAKAYAEKRFPECGHYTARSRQAPEAFAPALEAFLESYGFVPESPPQGIALADEEWEQFHLIISVGGSVERLFDVPPFRTVTLSWDVEDPQQAGYEAVYRQIAVQVTDLIQVLHGVEAS